MTRIIIHAGFHKTGTSSAQHYLKTYKKALTPHTAVYLKKTMGELRSSGRIYGQYPTFIARHNFAKSARAFFDKIPDRPQILVSRETLCGIIPGHLRFGHFMARTYDDTAPILAKILVSKAKQRFPDAEIVLVYSLREYQPWAYSCWAHVVRSTNLSLDYPTFLKKIRPYPSPEKTYENIRSKINNARVEAYWLEDFSNAPAGPAQGILSLLDLPLGFAEKHPAPPRQNIGDDPDLTQEFLALNRKIRDRTRLKLEKEALLSQQAELRRTRLEP